MPDTDTPMDDRAKRLGFLLVPGFATMSYASAIEPFRAANVLSGRELYRWRHISPAGTDVRSSTGLAYRADHLAGDRSDYDTVFVCAGGNPATFDDRRTFQWLRSLARQGVALGGVSGGPFILARASLLDGYRCTVHWEHVPAFREAFPRPELTTALYEIDRDRLTCAGGVAALDMMHELIEREHGPELAAAVSEWFLQTHVRAGSANQLMTRHERFGLASPRLSVVIEAMEANVEDPLPREELADVAGVSLRQLERLFARHMKTSVDTHYRRLRLERARALLRQTTLTVSEIAMATGFVSPSHFSRSYKARFGHAPARERESARPA
ncbi:GlxA family transcriptional regulator [Lutibaculum baratangense]|uniref:Putative transcriptional regulator AraC/XylS n=1 Tax=Lutibaculum baratangense AMV1 TaxID=631454 RepID=V4RGM4_9HYPH|nr:GlxA family transcriptional regulator [Lutibaculum baratangense]ESR24499.1 putative transcriptional regulator AraC/XylS [Lutibaculum baratangense AMV1]